MGSHSDKKPLPEIKPNAVGDAIYKVLGYSAKGLYHLLMSVKVDGMSNLPHKTGYIVVSNHLTAADPITVAYPVFNSGTLPRFLAKESLFRAPVLGWILQKLAHIPVSRGSVDARKSLETAQNVVEAGGAVIIYPEGTHSTDPDFWPMQGRTGAARLALATGVPVVPIAHFGDQEFLPSGGKPQPFPRKTVHVKVGAPIDLSTVIEIAEGKKYSRAELQLATDTMLDAVTQLLEEIRGEQRPEGRWNPATGVREIR